MYNNSVRHLGDLGMIPVLNAKVAMRSTPPIPALLVFLTIEVLNLLPVRGRS